MITTSHSLIMTEGITIVATLLAYFAVSLPTIANFIRYE
jgi:hypothetical protein